MAYVKLQPIGTDKDALLLHTIAGATSPDDVGPIKVDDDYRLILSPDTTINVLGATGGGSGGAAAVDDTIFTPMVGLINPIGAYVDELAPDTIDEGDLGILRMTPDRQLRVRSSIAKTPIYQYAENNTVSSTTETTVLSYTPSVDTMLTGFIGSGSTSYRFKLKINGVTKLTVRTTPADRNVQPAFSESGLLILAGQTVTITGYHEETSSQTAEIALFGNIDS